MIIEYPPMIASTLLRSTSSPLSTCPFLLKRFAARRDAKTGRLVKSSKDERTSPQSKAGGRIHPLKFLRSRGKKREGKPRLLDLITPWENSD